MPSSLRTLVASNEVRSDATTKWKRLYFFDSVGLTEPSNFVANCDDGRVGQDDGTLAGLAIAEHFLEELLGRVAERNSLNRDWRSVRVRAGSEPPVRRTALRDRSYGHVCAEVDIEHSVCQRGSYCFQSTHIITNR